MSIHMHTQCVPYVHLMSINATNWPYVYLLSYAHTMCSICTLHVFHILNVFHMYTQCFPYVSTQCVPYVHLLLINTPNAHHMYTYCRSIQQIVHMYTDIRSLQQIFPMYTFCRSIQQIVPYVHLLSINTTNCSICTLTVDQYNKLSICTLNVVPYVQLNVFHMYTQCRSIYNSMCQSICTLNVDPCVHSNCPYVHSLCSICTTQCIPYVH